MVAKTSPQREAKFVEMLAQQGGSLSNPALIAALDWPNDVYSAVKGALLRNGKITIGRGQGGVVALIITNEKPSKAKATKSEIGSAGKAKAQVERPLYEPVSEAILKGWVETRGYNEFVYEETHSQGSRSTGGTYTRPDFTVVGITKFVYLPQRDFEVVTFEIKPSSQLTVLGVLEALAHRESAHRSYAVYQANHSEFDQSPERSRIEDLAEKFGIGIFVAENPGDFATWMPRVEAVRHEPDPRKVNDFIARLSDEKTRMRIADWFR